MAVEEKILRISRKLRKEQTPWEIKLWQALRNRRFENCKFRRQFQIGKYIVDFCCLEKMLVIELDGGQHNNPSARISDTKREMVIESHGYKVLRFWNNEVDKNLEGVLERIRSNLV